MAWTSRRDRNFPRLILDFVAPVAVSTETPLLALTELAPEYVDLVFTFRNHDPATPVAFFVEQSESGVVTDEERETVYVAPLRERTLEFRDVLRSMWGVSAAGNPEGGFPTVNVSFRLVGRLRWEPRVW